MNLFRNSRGIATWDMKSIANNKQVCLGLEVNCIYGQKHKERRVQLEFLKIYKWIQNQPCQTNKLNSAYFMRPT